MSFGDTESVQSEYVRQLELDVVEKVQRIEELERAMRNVLLIARREGGRPMGTNAWQHVIRLCNEVGIDGDGVLRTTPSDSGEKCHAGKDGDCNWSECPQEKDNRKNYQPWCPLASDSGETVDRPHHGLITGTGVIPGEEER